LRLDNVDRIVGPSHFQEQLRPIGDLSVTVAVAGLSVRFEGLSAELQEACLRRYAPFLSKDKPLHSVAVSRGETAYLELPEDRFLRLEEAACPEGQVLLSHNLAALREPKGKAGQLKLSRPNDQKDALRGIECYLRWVVADLALQQGGFVLHSSGLARNGKAHVFFGPSGAGKSTVASLSPDCTLLSDDLVLITKRDGKWMAATTPFWGTLPQECKDAGLYPLAGLYRLTKSEEVRLAQASPAVAAGMVLACCPFVANPALRREKLVPLVDDCTRRVPTRSLLFRKDSTFWTIIKREARHG
jgi:hypothetical protein